MDSLNVKGFFIDDLKRLRVMEPQVAEMNQNLSVECERFGSHVSDFSSMANTFITWAEKLSVSVEKAKLMAVGNRNLLKSAEKQQLLEQQRLQSIIAERQRELNQLDVYIESLESVVKEQEERIAHITSQH